jgi:hypothetical protein
MQWPRGMLWPAGLTAAALAVLMTPRPCLARTPLAAHLDGGFGFADVRPLTSPRTFSATMSAGLSRAFRSGARAVIEINATLGGDIGGKIPEGPFSGNRSLTTFLLSLETSDARDARGVFAEAGMGFGHATLSGATKGWRDFASGDWRYPNRNLVGLAFGGSVGYRTHGGPGPLGLQLACRYHGVGSGGRVAASAIAITLGLAW